jgi:glutathione S-transferase
MPYLLGDSFTIADLNVASVFYFAWFSKYDFSAAPHFAAWLTKCLERPACKTTRKLRE